MKYKVGQKVSFDVVFGEIYRNTGRIIKIVKTQYYPIKVLVDGTDDFYISFTLEGVYRIGEPCKLTILEESDEVVKLS